MEMIEMENKKKEKAKSEFVQRVIRFINEKGLQVVEEKSWKAKEYKVKEFKR